LTKLNIKQARKLVDEAPQAVITRVPRVQAEALKIEMEGFGASVELRASVGLPGAPTDLV
jgi:ribosomal protein L7/L12